MKFELETADHEEGTFRVIGMLKGRKLVLSPEYTYEAAQALRDHCEQKLRELLVRIGGCMYACFEDTGSPVKDAEEFSVLLASHFMFHHFSQVSPSIPAVSPNPVPGSDVWEGLRNVFVGVATHRGIPPELTLPDLPPGTDEPLPF